MSTRSERPTPIDIGIPAAQRTRIAAGLSALLADSYTLYLMTHNFHWNVTGPMFNTLHQMFMQQYTEQWTALDQIAERIRALGELAPQGYAAFGNLSSIKDGDADQDWEAMLKELLADTETVIATLRGAFPVADEAGDEATTDLITQRLQAHEKHAWMLRATLGLK